MMISNHFLLCKEWNHHPIDSQPTIVIGWPLRLQVLSHRPKAFYPGLGRSRGGHRFAPAGDLETPHRHCQVVPGEVDAAGGKEGGGRVSVVVGLAAALFFFGGGRVVMISVGCLVLVEATKNNQKRYTFLCEGFGK